MPRPTLQLFGKRYRQLFPDLFRPLTPDERQRLERGLAQFRIRYPIIVDDSAPVVGVINGWQRLEIIVANGGLAEHELLADVYPNLTLEQKRLLAETVNFWKLKR